VQLFGAKYAMRIWLDPNKLNTYSLTPTDVVARAGTECAGGDRPARGYFRRCRGTAQRHHHRAEPAADARTVRNIIMRSQPRWLDACVCAMSRASNWAGRLHLRGRYNGQPATGMGIQLASGANALRTAQASTELLAASAAAASRTDSKPSTPYDTTPFVRISIEGGREDAARGHRAGLPGDVPVPAELACDAHSDHRGAGGAAGHLRHVRSIIGLSRSIC
jgi:multidrug efflux pump